MEEFLRFVVIEDVFNLVVIYEGKRMNKKFAMLKKIISSLLFEDLTML